MGAVLSYGLGLGPESGVQGLRAQDQAEDSFLSVVFNWKANSSPPRPPKSPGSFPVTAGSIARAIYNSYSRLCSAVSSLEGQGEGQLLLGTVVMSIRPSPVPWKNWDGDLGTSMGHLPNSFPPV